MKKFIFILLLLFFWPVAASPKIYNSPFGFSVNLSSHWLIVSREELKNRQDIIKRFSNIVKDKRYRAAALKPILRGEIECYYNLKTSHEYFYDIIAVEKKHKDLPGLLKECDGLSAALSKAFGRPIEVFECGYKKMGNLSGFFVDFEGFNQGCRSFTFYFLNLRNEVIMIGGTCKNETLDVFRKEYEDIITSLKVR